MKSPVLKVELARFWEALATCPRSVKIVFFLGFAYQGKDIVFRFIIEYSSLKDFGLQVIGLFLYEDFSKMMIFWLVLKLEINYRVINILKDFGFF
jgi:hypothetical protein